MEKSREEELNKLKEEYTKETNEMVKKVIKDNFELLGKGEENERN